MRIVGVTGRRQAVVKLGTETIGLSAADAELGSRGYSRICEWATNPRLQEMRAMVVKL